MIKTYKYLAIRFCNGVGSKSSSKWSLGELTSDIKEQKSFKARSDLRNLLRKTQ